MSLDTGKTKRNLKAEADKRSQLFNEGDIVKTVYKMKLEGKPYAFYPFVGVVKTSTDNGITVKFPPQYTKDEETSEYSLRNGKYVEKGSDPKLERCRVLKLGDQVSSTTTGEKMYSVCICDVEPGLVFLREDGELRLEESELEMFFPFSGVPHYNLPELEPCGQEDPWLTPTPPPIENADAAVRDVCEELNEWIDESVVTDSEKAQAFCNALNTDSLLRQKISTAQDAWVWGEAAPGTCFYRKLVYVLQKVQYEATRESRRRSQGRH